MRNKITFALLWACASLHSMQWKAGAAFTTPHTYSISEHSLQCLPPSTDKNNTSAPGNIVTDEGAWCWFADPRALHYENSNGSINATYIGYIDVHGNIKATQIDMIRNERKEVLVRSCFQPDDHNNPTFLVLPDERIMIFYTRHTDEPRIWYRVSTEKGDITSLGKEQYITTDHNTTYPSPFILSDDPTHIYLCWRGINWHPTIARFTLPDKEDRMQTDFGPYQIVQSTGARPYAKYQSNGRDKIYLTYTTGHPDNEWPCWLYFNVIDINKGDAPILKDIKGNDLAKIGEKPFKVAKTQAYKVEYPYTIVDAPNNARNWVWQIATDKQEHPVIALTRISQDKLQHRYLLGRWTGKKWHINEIANGGHAFHQNWDKTEKCYSGGMAIDPENTNIIYTSEPTNGVYEIWQNNLKTNGTVKSRTAITQQSAKNNMRPYVIPHHGRSPLTLAWMNGDYYYWIVGKRYPQGYPTAIHSNYTLPAQTYGHVLFADKEYKGQTLEVGRDTLIGVTADNHLYLRIGRNTYKSECLYLTSNDWARFSGGTSGDAWPTRIQSADLKLCQEGRNIVLYRNNMIEIKVNQ